MRVGDPQWTARPEESEGAQDPLGMNRVMDRLLRELLPGITTISPRPRYIAHHLWALRDVAERDEPESRAQLVRGLYARERVFLLAGVRHSQGDAPTSHTNLVGARTAHGLFRDDPDSISLDFSFLSNRSGSYGQNYIGPLQTMGLVDTPEDAVFEHVTERGTPIADAYGEVAERTDLATLVKNDTVSVAEVDAIASELCPCAVNTPDAPDRDVLRSLYVGRDHPDAYAEQARTRRETLTLILHTASVGGETATLSPSNLVDACYYGTIQTDGEFIDATIPPGLADTAAQWKALRAHDYFRYATEAALVSWLAYLKRTDEADATLEAFKNQARTEAVCDRMSSLIGSDVTLTPRTPLSTLVTAVWPDTPADTLFGDEPGTPVEMSHPASEHALDDVLQTALESNDWETVAAVWPCLLVTLALRFAAPTGPEADAWVWLRAHTQDDLSPVRFRSRLRAHVADEASIREFIDWVVDRYVIERGVEIAASKGDGGGSRGYFDRTGAGWRLVRDHSPGHWGARFGSAVTVLRDLALLTPDPSSEGLTAAGVELLDAERTGEVG